MKPKITLLRKNFPVSILDKKLPTHIRCEAMKNGGKTGQLYESFLIWKMGWRPRKNCSSYDCIWIDGSIHRPVEIRTLNKRIYWYASGDAGSHGTPLEKLGSLDNKLQTLTDDGVFCIMDISKDEVNGTKEVNVYTILVRDWKKIFGVLEIETTYKQFMDKVCQYSKIND